MKKGPTIERPKLVHVHLIESEKIVSKMKPLIIGFPSNHIPTS